MTRKSLWLLIYPLVLILFGIYSYSQVAPNLVLSSNAYFWQFQQFMWQLGYHNRSISTAIYVTLILASFVCYGLLLHGIAQKRIDKRLVVIQWLLCIAALIPSYPALSNDIFNYLMNAKMMHVYSASPYTHAAWDFPQEPWLAFMMNIHTTTPYGYIWTGLGYILYALALGDLQLGMLLFRLLSVFSVAAIAWGIWNIVSHKKRLYLVGFFIFNPLAMLEAINNTHNDITMMAFLVVGIAFYFKFQNQSKAKAILAISLGWVSSVYTKLVTVILPGVYLFALAVRNKIPWFNAADYSVWLLLLAMFGDGSKRFFSWYLLWAVSLSPLSKSTFSKILVILFSITGLLSYVFFLNSGEYSKEMGYMRIGLLFSLPILYITIKGFSSISTSLPAIIKRANK